MAHGCVPVVVSDDFQAPLDRQNDVQPGVMRNTSGQRRIGSPIPPAAQPRPRQIRGATSLASEISQLRLLQAASLERDGHLLAHEQHPEAMNLSNKGKRATGKNNKPEAETSMICRAQAGRDSSARDHRGSLLEVVRFGERGDLRSSRRRLLFQKKSDS